MDPPPVPALKFYASKAYKGYVFAKRLHLLKKTPFMSKKETFLANSENKQCFIKLLSKTMQENGIITRHATSDADVILAKTAILLALIVQTVLFGKFGKYNDLLVLLLKLKWRHMFTCYVVCDEERNKHIEKSILIN